MPVRCAGWQNDWDRWHHRRRLLWRCVQTAFTFGAGRAGYEVNSDALRSRLESLPRVSACPPRMSTRW